MIEQLKRVIVTGAAGGMGSSAVRLLLARGSVRITAVDRDGDRLRELTLSLPSSDADHVVTVEADVSVASDVDAYVKDAVARWDGLDGIFNIAGIAQGISILEMTVDDYERTMSINARSAWLGMKFALPALLAAGGGRIVNTGSHLAHNGSAMFSAYAASKHAVVGMTRSVALEYAKQGIVANVVCPGAMDTTMIWEAFRVSNPDDPAKARQDTIDHGVPNGRLARPEELAATGVWLLLDSPAHLSGQVISVDGAMSA